MGLSEICSPNVGIKFSSRYPWGGGGYIPARGNAFIGALNIEPRVYNRKRGSVLLPTAQCNSCYISSRPFATHPVFPPVYLKQGAPPGLHFQSHSVYVCTALLQALKALHSTLISTLAVALIHLSFL